MCDLEIDLASRVVRVGGAAVQLSAREYDLLVGLAEDPERVFRKEELLRDVWGFRSLGRTRTLDSHASRLRRKLNRPGGTAYVLNVWGDRREGAGKRRKAWTPSTPWPGRRVEYLARFGSQASRSASADVSSASLVLA